MSIRAANKKENTKGVSARRVCKKGRKGDDGEGLDGSVSKQCECGSPAVGDARAGGLRFSAVLPLEKRHPRPLWGTSGTLRVGGLSLASSSLAYSLREGRPARKNGTRIGRGSQSIKGMPQVTK